PAQKRSNKNVCFSCSSDVTSCFANSPIYACANIVVFRFCITPLLILDVAELSLLKISHVFRLTFWYASQLERSLRSTPLMLLMCIQRDPCTIGDIDSVF